MAIRMVDLRAEAAAEVRRVSRARAITRVDDERALAQLEGEAAWIATSHRAKRALGRRVCLLWRVAFEDASGRVVEARLVPMLVDVTRGGCETAPSRRAWIRSVLEQADWHARARIDVACDAWRREVVDIAGAFTATRLARERDIAASQQPASSGANQGGLFDRRAEREHRDRAAGMAESEQATRDRLQAAAGTIALAPPRLLLVLLP
jgi:hypothetical protein